MARKKLGEILIEKGLIDGDQLNSALAYQRQWGHRLGVAMVAKGFISEGMLTKVLSESLNIAMVDLANVRMDKEALRMVPLSVCEQHGLVPVALRVERGRKRLTVAMSDPLDVSAVEEIEFTTGASVHAVLAQISSINGAVRRYYRGEHVEIAPLQFKMDVRGDETMTLMRDGGEEEIVEISASGQGQRVLDLHDEVTDRTALAEIVAARRRGQASVAVSQIDIERIDALERKFWALMRALARKGYVTKEEFLRELQNA